MLVNWNLKSEIGRSGNGDGGLLKSRKLLRFSIPFSILLDFLDMTFIYNLYWWPLLTKFNVRSSAKWTFYSLCWPLEREREPIGHKILLDYACCISPFRACNSHTISVRDMENEMKMAFNVCVCACPFYELSLAFVRSLIKCIKKQLDGSYCFWP